MQFSYVASTDLPLDRVWNLLTDIQNWPEISHTYLSLRWVGEAWVPGSYLRSRVRNPGGLELCHVVRTCQAPSLLRLLSYGNEAGFAVESTIQLEQVGDRTLIHIDAYAVGNPVRSLPGGVSAFLIGLTERWFSDFAAFCDRQLASASEREESRLPSPVP